MSQDPANHPNSPDTKKGTRSPVVAGLLSILLPGTGHVYVGQKLRGTSNFALALTMVVLLYWATTTSDVALQLPLRVILFALAIAFWLWQAMSAALATLNRRVLPSAGLILVLGFAYVLGWQATDIDLAQLFTPSSNTLDIFTKIVWPWDAAVEREQNIASAKTPFANPCPENLADAPPQVKGDGSKPWMVIEPACGEFSRYDAQTAKFVAGTRLTMTGGGFEPGKEIEVWWLSSLGHYYQPSYGGETLSVMPGQDGNFTISFDAPQESNETKVGVIIHYAEVRQLLSEGEMRLTSNFELALSRILVTIFQALMATSFGLILAIPASFLAARNLMMYSPLTRVIYYAVRFVMNVIRSIEPFIWAVIATVWVGLGPFAGVMALTLHTIASLGKLYSEAIESIEPGPIEAITATGANRLQTIVYGIVPQVIPPFLSFTIYRWDINVRMATIIGLVGGGGIGQILFQWINQNLWREAGIAAWLITITVTAMDYLSSELRKRFI